jgi:hypothetical protein
VGNIDVQASGSSSPAVWRLGELGRFVALKFLRDDSSRDLQALEGPSVRWIPVHKYKAAPKKEPPCLIVYLSLPLLLVVDLHIVGLGSRCNGGVNGGGLAIC